MPKSKEERLVNWGDLVDTTRENEARFPGATRLVDSLAAAHGRTS